MKKTECNSISRSGIHNEWIVIKIKKPFRQSITLLKIESDWQMTMFYKDGKMSNE